MWSLYRNMPPSIFLPCLASTCNRIIGLQVIFFFPAFQLQKKTEHEIIYMKVLISTNTWKLEAWIGWSDIGWPQCHSCMSSLLWDREENKNIMGWDKDDLRIKSKGKTNKEAKKIKKYLLPTFHQQVIFSYSLGSRSSPWVVVAL